MKFLCLVFLYVSFFVEGLQMHIHNTGQGNSIFFRNEAGTDALIVDFGAHQSGKYRYKWGDFDTGRRYRPIYNFLKDVNKITVVITHAHSDHHSLFRYLPVDIYSKIDAIYASVYGDGVGMDLPMSATFAKNKTGGVIEIGEKRIPWIEVDYIEQIPIKDALGTGVQIYPVLPIAWPTTGKGERSKRSEDANDNSISLVVSYGDSRVLLTGDSTGATLNAVQKVSANEDVLQNITCMLLPHHGSNLNGAFSWFYYIKSRVTGAFSLPLLTIISSDPMECDRLPWAGVTKFRCDRPGGISKVPIHKISAEGISEYCIDEPVYLTANARSKFFRVIFAKDGSCVLYDGEPTDFAPDLLKVPVECGEDVYPGELIENWGRIPHEDQRNTIKAILESTGDFSTELPNYIEWISNKLASLKDDELFLLAIKNLNSFTKTDLFQKVFSQALLRYLSSNVNDISEDLVMICLINHHSLFLGENLSGFSGFLHKYLDSAKTGLSIKLVMECLKHHESLFPETGADLAELLLSRLSGSCSYGDWQECMVVAMNYVKDKGFLTELFKLIPLE